MNIPDFFEEWDSSELSFERQITTDDAEARYKSAGHFVARYEIDRGFGVIEFNSENIVVFLVDETDLIDLEMVFGKCDKDTLFLQHAIVCEEDDHESSTTYFSFLKDGTLNMKRVEEHSGSVEERSVQIDMQRNFIAIPRFGEFEELLRRDRSEIVG